MTRFALIFGLLGSACIAPEENFRDWKERFDDLPPYVDDSGAGTIDAEAGVCTLAMDPCVRTDGNQKIALLTVAPQALDIVVNLRGQIDLVNGGDEMLLTAQAYSQDLTRLVGDPTVAGPFVLEPDGSFLSDRLELDLPGEANPILPGTPARVAVTLAGGKVCDDTQFACGTLTGTVLDPVTLDLGDSTWTAQVLDDETNLPPPIRSCACDIPAPPMP